MGGMASRRQIWVGGVPIGGGAPVAVQSMTKTETADYEATMRQIHAIADAGGDIVRCAVPRDTDVDALKRIVVESPIPVIADIHFNYTLALKAIDAGAHCIRLNPGNIGGPDKVALVAEKAKAANVPMRIGVNSGSLPKHLHELEREDSVAALVQAAVEFVELMERLDFENFKVSIKSTSVPNTIASNRLLAAKIDYPLHLGITEAGTKWSGSLKSSVGLGTLLADGIGDTIRISLSTFHAEEEVKVAWEILKALKLREKGPVLIACPTCGRLQFDMDTVVAEIEQRLETYEEPIEVAVLGCAVNGIGEASHADFGITGAKNEGLIFAHGKPLRKVATERLVEELFVEIDKSIAAGRTHVDEHKSAEGAEWLGQDRGGERRRDDPRAHGGARGGRGERRRGRRRAAQARDGHRSGLQARSPRRGALAHRGPPLHAHLRMFLRSLLAALLASAAIAVVAAPAARGEQDPGVDLPGRHRAAHGYAGPGARSAQGSRGEHDPHARVLEPLRAEPDLQVASLRRPEQPELVCRDRLGPVRRAREGGHARGIGILMTPTGFTPRWAEQCKTVGKFRNCDPNPKDYGKFVTAVARRYSGTFVVDGAALPRVKRWSLWNEPDQTGWIAPQASKGVETSPQIYRNLVYSGLASLRATGHAADQVLLGELAPAHRGTSTDPTSFLLNLFCIDAKGHKLTGKARTQQGCQRFKRFTGISGFAHHPYNLGAAGPALKKPRFKGDISLYNIEELPKILKLGRPRASDPVRPADLLHGVRHPDEAAGARPDHTGAAGRVDQPDGLPDLAEQEREERRAVRARGRRDPEPAGLQHRADPEERHGEAEPRRLPAADLGREARDERHALGLGQARERHAAAGPDSAQHRRGLHDRRHPLHRRPRLHQREPGRQQRYLAYRLDRAARAHGRAGHVADYVFQPGGEAGLEVGNGSTEDGGTEVRKYGDS